MDFLLKAHASGLGHDAVIEIMVALLGIMIALLTLVAALVSFLVAVLGFVGFKTIKDEVREIAEKVAREIATKIASEEMEQTRSNTQATDLSDSQLEEIIKADTEIHPRKRERNKAASDSELNKGEGRP
jgi:hypothetical protein